MSRNQLLALAAASVMVLAPAPSVMALASGEDVAGRKPWKLRNGGGIGFSAEP